MSQKFRDSENVVHERMGISDEWLVHNRSNQILVDGAKRVGHHVEKVPVRDFLFILIARSETELVIIDQQNTGGYAHDCGRCGFGCPTGQK